MHQPSYHHSPGLRCPKSATVGVLSTLLWATLPLSYAQTSPAPPSSPTATEEEPITLSVFEVRSEQVGRYQVSEAASGGRIRADLMDTPASISVITKELLSDVAAERLLDALKYTSGVTEGITPNGLERVTLRGFQSDFTVMDGFRTGAGQMNFDPAIMERIEVMKGPNAVLQPQGTPGGTVNAVTKSPSLNSSYGYANAQVGLFAANQASVDYNYVILPKQLAARVVLSGHDSDGWWDESYTKRYMFNPMVSYQFGSATKLTVKYYLSDYEVHTYGGLPIDPSVGTDDELRIFPGLNRRSNPRGPEEKRIDERSELTAFLTTRIGDNLSVRFAGRLLDLYTDAFATNPALSDGGSYNPLTGKWVGGTVFGAAPTFTPSPAPAVNTTVPRSGGDTDTNTTYRNFQNDYSYLFEFPGGKSTTTAGFAYTDFYQDIRLRTGTRGTVNILDLAASRNIPTTFGPLQQQNLGQVYERQFYIQETLQFWKDRITLNFGGSQTKVDRTLRQLVRFPGLTETVPQETLDSHNYGIVYRPIPELSVYYGRSSNANTFPNFTGSSIQGSVSVQEGIQHEVGAKFNLGDGRVFVTVAYFDIAQTNFAVDNPGNYTSPPPNPRLPVLLFDRTSKGYEININATITKELSVVGQFYHGKNRDPNGVPFQASPDNSGGLFARYNFSEPALKGLGMSLGVDYLGKRPGVQASGFTRASTPEKLIPNQPSFYAPARTLANYAIYYTRGKTRYQLNIDNIFNEKYLSSTFTRNGIWVGTPTNVKFSVTRNF